jgi:hypothetical protein
MIVSTGTSLSPSVRYGSFAPEQFKPPDGPFVRYALDSDRRRGNAAKAAKYQSGTLKLMLGRASPATAGSGLIFN